MAAQTKTTQHKAQSTMTYERYPNPNGISGDGDASSSTSRSISRSLGRRTSLSRCGMGRWVLVVMVLFICQMTSSPYGGVVYGGGKIDNVYSLTTDGPDSLKEGKRLFNEMEYMDASYYFWRAVLLQQQSDNAYTVEDAFTSFMQCYAVLDRTADGFVFIAKESMQRGQKDMAMKYLEQAIDVDPAHKEARELQTRFGTGTYAPPSKGSGDPRAGGDDAGIRKERKNKFQPAFGTPEADDPLMGKSPEDLYEYGSTLFSRRNYEHCADVFELSCRRSGYTLGPSCSNAVYCRSMILDWGFNGTGFQQDMERIIELTQREANQWRHGDVSDFVWNRATSVHPHMMLGYPIPPQLKRYVAESVAFMDEKMARLSEYGTIDPLPIDMPFEPEKERPKFVEQASQPDFKLKVGFVSSGFNSKAVLYLSQDIFRFYDRSKIEMHVFSLGPPDNDNFIKYGMGGVDWRKRVQSQVDHFHDVVSNK